MPPKIEFTAHYGDQLKQVELSTPYGGGDGYHVYIDRYYNGVIVKLNGEWVGHFNPKSELQAFDIEILGEMIDNSLKE